MTRARQEGKLLDVRILIVLLSLSVRILVDKIRDLLMSSIDMRPLVFDCNEQWSNRS